jgi:hypothetical protein
MTALRKSVEEYLAMRRRLGFKLQEAGLRLNDFVSFMEDRRARRITKIARCSTRDLEAALGRGPRFRTLSERL